MIHAEAVEAAKRVAYERYGSRPDTAYLRTILEAAAPHMLTPTPTPTAAERAMTDITALLEQHYAGNIYSPDVINGVSRIVGRYDMERIGEGA